jgi:hypothetical protein
MLLLALAACGSDSVMQRKIMAAAHIANPDSMGVMPTAVKRIPVDAPRSLGESSSAVITAAQPDIVFTINDSGNDPELFALDTTGGGRGVWRIAGASNIDWEAMSPGPCATTATAAGARACLYIADAGDNSAMRPQASLYRVAEPPTARDGEEGTLPAERLSFRYPDSPHDVEAIYTSNGGDTFLLTKRALKDTQGHLRPSLVFLIPASAWGQHDVMAQLVDSLAIVPGSARLRQITDASLSHDSRFLAVRTYGQVYIFATDSLSGRVVNSVRPVVCNIQYVERTHGEGIAWFGSGRNLLLDSEGRNAPMHRITCPLPQQ